MDSRIAVIASVIIAALLAGTAIFAFLTPESGDKYAQCRKTKIAGTGPALGGAFTLIGEDGTEVSHSDILRSPSLIYFGYSFCPDVCPLDSARTADTVGILSERGIDVPHVFITVDPERDTPEVMAEFTSYFDDNMIGLTGDETSIAEVAKSYRVYFAKNGDGDDYLMDHSTMTYLVDADGTVIEFFRRDLDADALADAVQCFAEAT